MSDDVCGAECADGTPCQHPAGSCPVASHSDSDEVNAQGRPSKFDDTLGFRAIHAAKSGMSVRGCARAIGVHHTTLQDWVGTDFEFTLFGVTGSFSTTFRRARAHGERKLVEEPLYDDDTDGQHARFLLSSSFDYVKTERQELENTGDEPLADVTIDFTDVDT